MITFLHEYVLIRDCVCMKQVRKTKGEWMDE